MPGVVRSGGGPVRGWSVTGVVCDGGGPCAGGVVGTDRVGGASGALFCRAGLFGAGWKTAREDRGVEPDSRVGLSAVGSR